MFDTTKKGNTKMYHQDQIRNKGFMVDRLTTILMITLSLNDHYSFSAQTIYGISNIG